MYGEDPAPPQRRHSVAPTAIWPWQLSTCAVPPGRPSSSTEASPKRSYITRKDRLKARPASTGESNGVGDCRVNEDSAGNGPLAKDISWAGPGLKAGEAGEIYGGGSSTTTVKASVEARRNQDEKWLSMTTTERRRLWLKRRRSGEFYFRSEFKGLVHAVMEARGWKPSCPPRVPDEDLTTPYVDHWEENQDGVDSHQQISNSSPLEEPHRCTLPCVANAADHGGSNGISTAVIIRGSDIPAPATAPPQREDSFAPGSGRPSQAWDLHWSYTKWAVETMRFARKLAPWQKVNHFRNSKELCRKDLMLKNLKKHRAQLIARGELAEAKAYNFFPVSFEMPKDYALFVEEFKETGGIWVMKPSGAAEGRGIFLFTKLSAVQAWAKPHLARRMKRHDPAKPASYVVQRYISNPYLVGGKKFDLRLYVLVTSFQPLTVYVYRDGFAKFSSTRFSTDPAHLQNGLMHLTNHAVQRRGAAVGKKWALKKFKLHVAMRHGRKAMDKLFWDIQALVVRTVRAVDRLVIQDKQSFELFGYDVLVDESLRPWLLEVNASPSLGASNREDLRLKKQMVGDALDIVDVEGRVPVGSPIREHVGGFDLAFHKGYAEVQPQACGYSSLFGAVVRNPIRQSRRKKRDKEKFSAFPLPWAETSSLLAMATGGKKARSLTSIPHEIDITHGTSNDPVGLESWRPNIHIFRPQDYWRGSIDYVPWKSEDNDDDVRESRATQRKGTGKGAEQGRRVIAELEAEPGVAATRRLKDANTSANVAPVNACTCSFVTQARVDIVEGDGGGVGAGIEGADFSGEVELGSRLRVRANQSGSGAVVMTGNCHGNGVHVGERGAACVKCALDQRASLTSGEVNIEAALHSVLDALRQVKAERLRLTARLTRTPQVDG